VNSLSSACLVSNYLDVYFLLLFFPQAMGWRDFDEVRMMIKLEERSDTIDGSAFTGGERSNWNKKNDGKAMHGAEHGRETAGAPLNHTEGPGSGKQRKRAKV
jgi:hypothetical protein